MPKYPNQGLPGRAGHFHAKQPRVSIRLFEETHGRKPRDMGNWAFSIPGEDVLWVWGMYGAAKRLALRHARSINATEVEVLP